MADCKRAKGRVKNDRHLKNIIDGLKKWDVCKNIDETIKAEDYGQYCPQVLADHSHPPGAAIPVANTQVIQSPHQGKKQGNKDTDAEDREKTAQKELSRWQHYRRY